MPSTTKTRRSEVSGVLRFSREMLISFGLALVFIVYVVQAFRIPSESMEDSLLKGDQLLALKFSYGSPILPFLHSKFPGLKNPEPGEAVIFRSPHIDSKDYIKRCVAGPGQTVEIRGTSLIVDGKEVELPPEGKYMLHGEQGDPEITSFGPVRIPARGEDLHATNLSWRDILFLKHLIKQENPDRKVQLTLQVYIDGVLSNHLPIKASGSAFTVDGVNAQGMVDKIDNWVMLREATEELQSLASATYPDRRVEVRSHLVFEGKPVSSYRVENDNYFMLGDNRDNSLDSRYWGFVNKKSVKAQAAIIYLSLDPDVPFWNLPMKIRWNRMGKLIRSWDGIGRSS